MGRVDLSSGWEKDLTTHVNRALGQLFGSPKPGCSSLGSLVAAVRLQVSPNNLFFGYWVFGGRGKGK